MVFQAYSAPGKAHLHEQVDFGAEGHFEKPMPLDESALQALRGSKDAGECATEENIQASGIPGSWFLASEIRLTGTAGSGLVVRGEGACFEGAHIVQFWVLEKLPNGYRVVLAGRADALSILPSVWNGHREIQFVFITGAGRSSEYVTMHFKQGQYVVAGRRIDKR